jgi:Kinesin motor domain
MAQSSNTQKDLFDVWVRIKPFHPILQGSSQTALTTNSRSEYNEGDSKAGGRNSISQHDSWQSHTPRRETRGRSKSPKLSRTPIADRDKIIPKKLDYKAFKIEGDKIVVEEAVDEVTRGGAETKIQTKSISFPHIISDTESNLGLFQRSLAPKIEGCFQGNSFTLLTYGISGSGKSHTIFGSPSPPQTAVGGHRHPTGAAVLGGEGPSSSHMVQEKGLLSYFLSSLFAKKSQLESVADSTSVCVQVSFIEIYNEQARDLLHTADGCQNRKLTIVESPLTNGVMVPDLKALEVRCEDQLDSVLGEVLERRVVCPNLNNKYSSRSHLIVEVVIKTTRKVPAGKKGEKGEFLQTVKTSKVRFVDLAGSEKVDINLLR